MNAPLKMGFVVRYGHGFLGDKRIVGKVEQAVTFDSREAADEAADFYCYEVWCGIHPRTDYVATSLAEVES